MERTEVIDWLCRLRSNIVTFLPKNWHKKITEALNFAIDSLKVDEAYQLIYEEPDVFADCISRQQVEEITWEDPEYTDPLNVLTEVREKIRALPPRLPKIREGHWIRQSDDYHDYYECDHCGIAIGLDDIGNYCPNCGSMMSKEAAANENDN